MTNGDTINREVSALPSRLSGADPGRMWWVAGVAVVLAVLLGGCDEEPSAGTEFFRDCEECPLMVEVPAGGFLMGSPLQRVSKPVHRVEIARPFAVGVVEVSFAEWDACVSGDGCGGHVPPGLGGGPAVNVSWEDAQSYVRWLSEKTGQEYRLLSESEWEYVARAGTDTRYHWGNRIGKNRANCIGCGSRWDGRATAPGASFKANRFGLFDMHGNVSEWVEDCWNGDYAGAPSDGSAREYGDCDSRVVRGGSWRNNRWHLRSAFRYSISSGERNDYVGFRIARMLTPE